MSSDTIGNIVSKRDKECLVHKASQQLILAIIGNEMENIEFWESRIKEYSS